MKNTIAAEQATALTKALFTLETLSDSESVLILEFLLAHEEATLLDLTIATGFDSYVLEEQLELLCQTEVVQLHSNIYSSWYRVDFQQLKKVNAIAHQLVKGK